MIFAYRDLHDIRDQCRSLFARWDKAIADGDTKLAIDIRQKELWPKVRSIIRSEAETLPGIYVFAGSDENAWSGVRYIGRTESTLRSRLEAYIKHDSCWDASLVGLPREAVHEVMWGRTRPVIRSTDAKLRDYQEQHYDACRKLSGGSLFVAGFEGAEATFIRSVEAGLIALAWANGAPLENQRFEKLPSIEERSVALTFIRTLADGWEAEGMSGNLVGAIRSAARRADAS